MQSSQCILYIYNLFVLPTCQIYMSEGFSLTKLGEVKFRLVSVSLGIKSEMGTWRTPTVP